MASFRASSDAQRASRQSRDVEQLELRIARRSASAVVDAAVIAAQPTFTAALNLCMNASGLTDKEVASALDIDAATWSRIRSGQTYFPQEKLIPLMELCGNDVPLRWLAERCGYELKPLRSELEQRIADLETQLAERDRDLAVIKRFVQETR